MQTHSCRLREVSESAVEEERVFVVLERKVWEMVEVVA
jgi:hypothetical protein